MTCQALQRSRKRLTRLVTQAEKFGSRIGVKAHLAEELVQLLVDGARVLLVAPQGAEIRIEGLRDPVQHVVRRNRQSALNAAKV